MFGGSPGGFFSKVPSLPKVIWKWRRGADSSERLQGRWVDAWAVHRLVVEPRVQQGESFTVSNIPLLSRDELIPKR